MVKTTHFVISVGKKQQILLALPQSSVVVVVVVVVIVIVVVIVVVVFVLVAAVNVVFVFGVVECVAQAGEKMSYGYEGCWEIFWFFGFSFFFRRR